MDKKKILMLITLFLCFFSFCRSVKAVNIEGNCSNYFVLKEVNYNEEKAFNNKYDKGDLNSGHFINGKTAASAGFPWTNTATNTTAWYYRTIGDKDLSSDAKLTITVYNNKNSNICKAIISGFETNGKDHLKVVLNHTGKNQWVNVKGTFEDNGNKSSSTVSSDIKIDTKKAIITFKEAKETKVETSNVTVPVLSVTAIASDPNAWGKWDSYSISKCEYMEDGGSWTTCKASKSTEKLNEGSKAVAITADIGNTFSKDKQYVFRVTFKVVKKSGLKTDGTVSFEYKNGSVINTTTTIKAEDADKWCTNGTPKDKNGNCLSDEEVNKAGTDDKPLDYEVKNGTRKADNTVIQMFSTDEDGNIIVNDYDSDEGCLQVSTIISKYWKYIMVIVPILLIIMMVLDFFKAMTSNDGDAIKKAGTNAVKRTIAAVILLALPALLDLVFGLFGLDLCI